MSNSSSPTNLKSPLNSPCEVDLIPDKTYFWCTCGLSGKQPFCDGTHKNSDTGLKSLPFTCESATKVWLCNCKKTKTPPYCDGSHKS